MPTTPQPRLLNRTIAGREIGIWIFLVLFPGAFIAGGSHLLYGFASNLTKVRAAADWPRHPGIVESSIYIVPRRRSQGGERIIYRYEVDGRQYRNMRTIYGAVSPAESRELAERYPTGQAVDVIVNPADPTHAMLEARMGGASWLLPAFGMSLLLVGAAIARFIVRATRPGLAQELALDAADLPPGFTIEVSPEPEPTPTPVPSIRERFHAFRHDIESDPYALIVAAAACAAMVFVLHKTLERDRGQAELESRLVHTAATLETASVTWRENVFGNARGTLGQGGIGPQTAVRLHELVVTYRYTVDGQDYIGTRLDFDDTTYPNEAEALARLALVKGADPLAVYYDPANPNVAVLDPRYTPNTQSPFFWGVGLLAVLCGAVAVRSFRRQGGPVIRVLARVAPAGLLVSGVMLAADVAVYAVHAPAAKRAQPVDGFLIETLREDGYPVRVRLNALHRPPEAPEEVPGGAWRFGLQHVWSEEAFDDVRFDYGSGERTFWMDPENPDVVALSREVGTLFGGSVRVLLGVAFLVFAATFGRQS